MWSLRRMGPASRWLQQAAVTSATSHSLVSPTSERSLSREGLDRSEITIYRDLTKIAHDRRKTCLEIGLTRQIPASPVATLATTIPAIAAAIAIAMARAAAARSA